MEQETWKAIPDYEGLYEASNLGRIRSLTYKTSNGPIRKGRVLKLMLNRRNGYLYVGLSKNGRQITKRVHGLVITAFLGTSELQVNHKDGDKTNNHLSNLEYVTSRQNIKHAMDIGLFNPRGENGNSVITNVQAAEIKELLKTTTLTQKRIGEMYGIAQVTVSQINVGLTWAWLGDYSYPIRKAA